MQNLAMEIYRIGIKKFQTKYNRIYNDPGEFCMFMREIGYKFNEYDVQICEMEMEYNDDKIARGILGPTVNVGGQLDIGDDFDPEGQF